MRKTVCLLLAIICISLLAAPVYGAQAAVVDQAALLTPQQARELEQTLQLVAQEHGIDMVVVTTDSLDGKSAMAYADDYYDYHGYGDDGVLLLVCMQTREWWISTCGICIDQLNAAAFEEDLVADLQAGRYYDGFVGFAEECERQMSVSIGGVIFCLLLGVGIALVVVLIMKSTIRPVRSQAGADFYATENALQLSNRSDIFLYQTISRRPRPQNTGGGSGGVHVGPSGRSHSGGGGRF